MDIMLHAIYMMQRPKQESKYCLVLNAGSMPNVRLVPIEILLDRAGASAPARFLYITEQNFLSEIMEVMHRIKNLFILLVLCCSIPCIYFVSMDAHRIKLADKSCLPF